MNEVSEPRKQVYDLEQALLDLPDEEKLDIDSMTQHHFGPGVYIRQFFLPAGCVVTGKIHKTKHLTIVASGLCSFVHGEGETELIKAPKVFTNKIGAKRAVCAIEDTVIMTVHPTTETDIATLESMLVTTDEEEAKQLEAQE